MSRSSPRFAVRIAGTASLTPGPRVTTAELAARMSPPRDAGELVARTGIQTRHIAEPDASPAQLAADTLRDALAAGGVEAADLSRVIFVSSGGGDLSFPATANLVGAALGLRGSCDCFDVNNACMGFLTALDLAARSIATGSGPVGIAVADLPSRGTTPADPRPYLVFGDAAAAAVLKPASRDEGILGSFLWNDGVAFGNVRLDNPTYTRRLDTIRFTASNAQMGLEAVEAVRRSADTVLAQAGLRLADVRWVLPHQPNGALLDAIVAALEIAPERVVRVVHEIGSVGAASIPVSLDRLVRSGSMRPGDLVLMVGVGGGLSSGAVLYRTA
jgi:3-oxoacyl-(acyl-carrier-protein) synthase III